MNTPQPRPSRPPYIPLRSVSPRLSFIPKRRTLQRKTKNPMKVHESETSSLPVTKSLMMIAHTPPIVDNGSERASFRVANAVYVVVVEC